MKTKKIYKYEATIKLGKIWFFAGDLEDYGKPEAEDDEYSEEELERFKEWKIKFKAGVLAAAMKEPSPSISNRAWRIEELTPTADNLDMDFDENDESPCFDFEMTIIGDLDVYVDPEDAAGEKTWSVGGCSFRDNTIKNYSTKLWRKIVGREMEEIDNGTIGEVATLIWLEYGDSNDLRIGDYRFFGDACDIYESDATFEEIEEY